MGPADEQDQATTHWKLDGHHQEKGNEEEQWVHGADVNKKMK